MAQLAVKEKENLARPLKVLVPLIKEEGAWRCRRGLKRSVQAGTGKTAWHEPVREILKERVLSERDLADAAKKLELSYSLVKVEQAQKPEKEQHATIQ